MTQAENSSQGKRLVLRLVVTAVVLALWFWTQSLIGGRTAPASGIGDALHDLTAGLNTYFSGHPPSCRCAAHREFGID